MTTPPKIEGLVPERLTPTRHRIFLQDYDLPVDIGFHDFEVGAPQRLLVSIDVWVEAAAFGTEDTAAAARQGVVDLRVSTRKPDVYPDCAGVGVELSSF